MLSLSPRICQCMRRFFVKRPKFSAATSNLRVEQNLVHLGRFLHFSQKVVEVTLKATFHLTISMRGQRATGKIQRNNYLHGSCGPSLTGKTMSVLLIFTQGTHRNVKNR